MTNAPKTAAPAPLPFQAQQYVNALPPSHLTDNSAALLVSQRIARETTEGTKRLAVERAIAEQVRLEESLKPRKLTPQEQAIRDEQAAYSRRFLHALGHSTKVATGPTPLPEVPVDA